MRPLHDQEVPNLCSVVLSSSKHAKALQNALSKESKNVDVYLQINVSGEPSKSGLPSVKPVVSRADKGVEDPAANRNWSETVDFAKRLRSGEWSCLKLLGIMGIGAPGASREGFQALLECKDAMRRELDAAGNDEDLLLNMGMSDDWSLAVEMGADVVRLGTTLFGPRPPNHQA